MYFGGDCRVIVEISLLSLIHVAKNIEDNEGSRQLSFSIELSSQINFALFLS